MTNGGEVQIAGAQDYTGTTTIADTPYISKTNQAIADTTVGIGTQLYAPTTLTVKRLANGGVQSGIGSSANDASNLVIQGSTLRFVGDSGAGFTNRLFTVGTRARRSRPRESASATI